MRRAFEVDLFKNLSITSVYKLLFTYNIYVAANYLHIIFMLLLLIFTL